MDKEEQDHMQFLDDDDVVTLGSEAWLEGSDEDEGGARVPPRKPSRAPPKRKSSRGPSSPVASP